jgi:hypothetical protein
MFPAPTGRNEIAEPAPERLRLWRLTVDAVAAGCPLPADVELGGLDRPGTAAMKAWAWLQIIVPTADDAVRWVEHLELPALVERVEKVRGQTLLWHRFVESVTDIAEDDARRLTVRIRSVPRDCAQPPQPAPFRRDSQSSRSLRPDVRPVDLTGMDVWRARPVPAWVEANSGPGG